MSETVPNAQKTRRSKFRFGLLSMLILFALASIIPAVFVSQPYRRSAANQFLQYSQTAIGRGGLEQPPPPNWQIQLYGEEALQPVSSIFISNETVASTEAYWTKLARHSKALPEVKSLSITNTRIPKNADRILASFRDLEELVCTRCQFDSILVLEKLHNARIVFLDQCDIRIEDAERLREKLPNTFFIVSNAGPEYASPIVR